MKNPIKDGAHIIAGLQVMCKNGFITHCILWNPLYQIHENGYFYEKVLGSDDTYTSSVYTPAQFRARVKNGTLIIR